MSGAGWLLVGLMGTTTQGPLSVQKSLYLLLLYQFTFAHNINRPRSDISGALGPIHYFTSKAFAMVLASVKHVLGVLECSYLAPEKPFFSSKIEFGSG